MTGQCPAFSRTLKTTMSTAQNVDLRSWSPPSSSSASWRSAPSAARRISSIPRPYAVHADRNADRQFADGPRALRGTAAAARNRERRWPVLHRELLPEKMPVAKLETLRVLTYDTRASKLVNVSIPMWLLRMAPSNKSRSVGQRHRLRLGSRGDHPWTTSNAAVRDSSWIKPTGAALRCWYGPNRSGG